MPAQHTSNTNKHGHLQLKLTAEDSKQEMHVFLKPNHYTCQQIISTEQKSRMYSGTTRGIHGIPSAQNIHSKFMFHSGSPSGKSNLFITCNNFLFNRLLLQSFIPQTSIESLPPAKHYSSDQGYSSICPHSAYNPAEKKYRNYYQLFQVWHQQRFSCPGSFQPIQ